MSEKKPAHTVRSARNKAKAPAAAASEPPAATASEPPVATASEPPVADTPAPPPKAPEESLPSSSASAAAEAPPRHDTAKSLRPHIRVVAAVVQWNKLYLITQRRDEASLALAWEFPGGKVEPGETDETALQRELRERLDVASNVGEKLAERHTPYAHYDITLALYSVKLDSASIRAKRVRAFRWIPSGDFEKYTFPDADQRTMDLLLGFNT